MPKRCFIAINLPQAVKYELEALIDELNKINNNSSINFIKRSQLHLTLHFLGEISEEQINEVDKLLIEHISKFSETEIITTTIGAFPNLNNPKILYLGIKEIGPNILTKLQKEIIKNLPKSLKLTEQINWTPHITLARFKLPSKFKMTSQELPELSIPIESIDLMHSQLSYEGPIYTVIKSYNLNNNI